MVFLIDCFPLLLSLKNPFEGFVVTKSVRSILMNVKSRMGVGRIRKRAVVHPHHYFVTKYYSASETNILSLNDKYAHYLMTSIFLCMHETAIKVVSRSCWLPFSFGCKCCSQEDPLVRH